MKTSYKKIIMKFEDDDNATQIYIAEDWVDAERIRGGDDEGVMCLCITDEAGDKILEALNGGQA
ncbi:hypothetical protein J2045_003419 [Peteryoungia aggregata LMG 23059]|uniref:DUF2283 domain-containing protein n=1 Tax=Peteryoungia aggregata LMG 23059 TaxID=1368425 RepID=A0ABU0GAJ0_9HYPH|nr:hypothetical protein [Peteryoungia aggregata]MDQ0422371.1 hypothetical protein [Peteryoungia aggregata LMG 23059]